MKKWCLQNNYVRTGSFGSARELEHFTFFLSFSFSIWFLLFFFFFVWLLISSVLDQTTPVQITMSYLCGRRAGWERGIKWHPSLFLFSFFFFFSSRRDYYGLHADSSIYGGTYSFLNLLISVHLIDFFFFHRDFWAYVPVIHESCAVFTVVGRKTRRMFTVRERFAVFDRSEPSFSSFILPRQRRGKGKKEKKSAKKAMASWGKVKRIQVSNPMAYGRLLMRAGRRKRWYVA